jgi:ComF family protein
LDNISNPRLDVRCGRCQQDPPPFDRTVALFPYESPIVQLIKGLKFQRRLSVAKLLGELFVERLKALCLPRPDLILPMPLHPTRLRERGFNQALEIARPIGRALRLPIDLAGAERIKQTAAQSTLSNEARKRNVAHAFELKKHYRGATIAVLDDVMTTQYTMIALCQLLKQAQAKQVIVWCAARAMHQVA